MNQIRYGIIGIKGIGDLHCRFARQNKNIELTALSDIDEDFLKKKSSEFSVQGFSDYRDMINSGLVDAVSIATPHYLHYQMCMDCLDAGLHVFVEKPLAVTILEAEKIVNKANNKKLKLSVGHQYRTFRTSRTLKHLIDTGEIGNIMHMLWSWAEFRPQSYYERDIWRKKWEYSGGGISIHSAIHDLDLICWLAGKPVQVNAITGNRLHNIETEDIFSANILFDNDAICTFQATVNQPKAFSIRQIAGDKGIIIMEDVNSLTFDHKDKILLGRYEDSLSVLVNSLKHKEGQPKTNWKSVNLLGDPPKWKKLTERLGLIKIKREHGTSKLMNSFIDAILNDEEPAVNGKSTLASLELMNAIILSAIKKKTVALPVDRIEYDSLLGELSSVNKHPPQNAFITL